MGSGNAKLLKTGIAGTIIAALCCLTPLLVLVLPAIGLGTWLAGADYVLFPLLAASLGLVGLGLYRRQAKANACCETEIDDKEGLKR